MDLTTPLKTLGIKYRTQGKKLDKLGIFTIEDLLFHIPARYDDLSQISPVTSVRGGDIVTIQGIVVDTQQVYTKRHFNIQKVYVEDSTGIIECVWFNQPYITQSIKKGVMVSIAGSAQQSGRTTNIIVREYEIITNPHETIHTGRLVPIYPETRGLSSKWIRNRIHEVLQDYLPFLPEFLPENIRQNNSLKSLEDALKSIHFPSSLEDAESARERLSFDELFLTQLAALKRKKDWEEGTVTKPLAPYSQQIEKFIKSLPFTLTSAQQKAIDEIITDLKKPKPMNRLVQGDVGSGKTIVAAVSLYIAHLNGYQGAYMAPTSILATQHYQTLEKLFTKFNVSVGLALGGAKTKKSEKNSIDNPNILIGTHALINEKITFKKLGLVVIDEQQRFGVEQRTILRDKGDDPHFLTMTATPIPRTIFLTLYGDLHLSYLSEMPKGRQLVKTWLVPTTKRDAAYEWIKKQIHTGGQVFIVCPFIEDSENMQTVKAATTEYERLKKQIFPEFKVGLLHGKMKGKDKNHVLSDFGEKKYDILVSTPVVEVGVDIPNATIMVIEGAERFGLAQLHQLRGRVGRGVKQSYCLLFSEQASATTTTRLKSMETLHSGAELAELDLKLRGPGEMFGTRQHGIPFLKIASFSNFPLIEQTRKEAEGILPILSSLPLLQDKLKSNIISKVSPD